MIRINLSNRNLSVIPDKVLALGNTLQELDLSGNNLTFLPKRINNLVNLQVLHLSNNKLTSLPEINNLVNLQKLLLSNNELISLPEINNLVNLHILGLNDNRLTSLPEINNLVRAMPGLPPNLEYLHLSDNKLTSLPSYIGNFINLKFLYYNNNPIENIPPNIIRMLNRNRNMQRVYDDRQSVHNHNVQECIKNSILNVLNGQPINPDLLINEILTDGTLTQLCKESLLEYCKCEDIHSTLNITFGELLQYVWLRITSHKESNNIKAILNEEMLDSECKCFTGRISRLVNCLNGFYDDIKVNISDNEQIGNIIIVVKNQMIDYDIDSHKRIVKERLEELGYDEDIINKWLEYILEN